FAEPARMRVEVLDVGARLLARSDPRPDALDAEAIERLHEVGKLEHVLPKAAFLVPEVDGEVRRAEDELSLLEVLLEALLAIVVEAREIRPGWGDRLDAVRGGALAGSRPVAAEADPARNEVDREAPAARVPGLVVLLLLRKERPGADEARAREGAGLEEEATARGLTPGCVESFSFHLSSPSLGSIRSG